MQILPHLLCSVGDQWLSLRNHFLAVGKHLFQHPIKSTSQETLKESAEEECRLQGSKIQGDKIRVFQRPPYIHTLDKIKNYDSFYKIVFKIN